MSIAAAGPSSECVEFTVKAISTNDTSAQSTDVTNHGVLFLQLQQTGSKYFFQWWVAGAPGFAILTVVLAFNFFGDGLRDLFDRRSATR